MPITERSVLLSAEQTREDLIDKAKVRLICRSPKCRELVGDEGSDDQVEPISLPYVYRYVVNELAAMNVKTKMEIRQDTNYRNEA
jgi:DNA-directed RNA polymerase I subunit RPA2